MCCVRNIVYFICIIILSISCSKNEEEPVKQASSSAAAMSVTAAPGMRMIPSNYTKQFGIYASCPNTNNNNKTFDNCKYKIKSYETGELEAVDKAIVFPSNDAETEFWGYYPYMSTAPIYTVFNWNNPTNQEILDLLVTKEKVKGKMTSPRVELQFYHAFSKIVLNISADSENSLLQDGELAGLEVKADMMNARVRYDMLNDKYTEITPLSTPITFNTQSNGRKSEAIICPDYNTDIDRVLTFTLNGKTCTWTIKAGTKFDKGICYIYDLRLKGDDLVEAIMTGKFNNWTDVSHGDLDLRDQ